MERGKAHFISSGLFSYELIPDDMIPDIQDYEELMGEELEALGMSPRDLEREFLFADAERNGYGDVMSYYEGEYEVALAGGIWIEAEHYLLLIMSLMMKKINKNHCG